MSPCYRLHTVLSREAAKPTARRRRATVDEEHGAWDNAEGPNKNELDMGAAGGCREASKEGQGSSWGTGCSPLGDRADDVEEADETRLRALQKP